MPRRFDLSFFNVDKIMNDSELPEPQDEGTVQQPAPPPASPPQAPFQPTSALAVWSLVNGILGWIFCPGICSLIAVVTGHMAIGEIRRYSFDGKGMAITGLILGYSMLILSLLGVFIGIVLALVLGGMSL